MKACYVTVAVVNINCLIIKVISELLCFIYTTTLHFKGFTLLFFPFYLK